MYFADKNFEKQNVSIPTEQWRKMTKKKKNNISLRDTLRQRKIRTGIFPSRIARNIENSETERVLYEIQFHLA